MTNPVKAFAMLLASTAIALAAAGGAAAHGGHHCGNSGPPLHGPGSSHNPIVYHPNHGPGSSHNPIVYHPNHGPGSSHNPIVATQPVVRDHRHHSGPHGGGPNGGAPSPEGGVTVTEGRYKVVVPVKVGDAGIIAVQCNGLCNPSPPPPPIVRDHR